MRDRERGRGRQRKIEMMCASLEVKYYVRTAPIFIFRYKRADPPGVTATAADRSNSMGMVIKE